MIKSLLIAALWIACLISPAYGNECNPQPPASRTVKMESGGTATITVSACVIGQDTVKMTEAQFIQGWAVHSPLWELKQCCLQSRHHAGLQSSYCFEPETLDRVNTPGICSIAS